MLTYIYGEVQECDGESRKPNATYFSLMKNQVDNLISPSIYSESLFWGLTDAMQGFSDRHSPIKHSIPIVKLSAIPLIGIYQLPHMSHFFLPALETGYLKIAEGRCC
jgi:hypothetical protein